MPGDDQVDEKLLELQGLLKRIWEAGALSESDYRTKLNGIWRSALFWRNAGRSAPWILNQLAAVEDEFMAAFETPATTTLERKGGRRR
ncbi:hypothetical protein JOH52_000814 [Sinorhizobium meliloti]|uniref:hypothetical protein n=1 Tax=Rhizobium meliloti TaxID=382 RepID=UPI000D11B607|nr:hypothetical protein [Sinorhizobium meliloti]MBP2464793.1 hypothetical protein [Sinorhizobium meliloti]MQW83414.1 hypothetical protein [Sinorhizobium meliloti]PST29518.1 hypothetical protein C7U62_02710 [Mesorhizobium loti]GEC36483.1 hypothetical protein EME01_05550 [Sinorhizobium meliloti]